MPGFESASKRLMVEFDDLYPGYGFAIHKGYATDRHREALRALGPSPIHRTSWNRVRELTAAHAGLVEEAR